MFEPGVPRAREIREHGMCETQAQRYAGSSQEEISWLPVVGNDRGSVGGWQALA